MPILMAMMMQAAEEKEVRSAPAQVRTFISRRGNCNHWNGEEPYDAERAAQIRAAVRELRCTSLHADEKRLRRRYARQPRLLSLLTRTEDLGGN